MRFWTPDILATLFLACAIVHTFSAKLFRRWARSFRDGSVGENLFHLLGEVEVVFGLWAGILIVFLIGLSGYGSALSYVEGLDFTEPVFVFVIMAVAATRPVLQTANMLISAFARLLPLPGNASFVVSALVLGPLSGSFITEPAAMTVTALILKDRFFDVPGVSPRLKYLVLGVLFVNVSVGGVLTPYAAPPVLMVAKKWGWDFSFMMGHFGVKAIVGVLANALLVLAVGSKELFKMGKTVPKTRARVPLWLVALHLLFMAAIVANAHHQTVFLGIFLFFLGVTDVTTEHQSELQLRESLLVGWFLAGLVTLGNLQSWWLQPLLGSLSEGQLFVASTGLTAVTDNAALTYLGSQVSGLSASMKYALVAGAVAGGGLTVIANAPNPAGFSILQKSFGREGLSPVGLLLGAAIPTVIVAVALWFLPDFSI